MNKIYKILPFFIVEFLAKRFCEKVDNKYISKQIGNVNNIIFTVFINVIPLKQDI